MDLKMFIRDVPDFPQKGILFKDITTLLKNPAAFRAAVDLLAGKYREKQIDKVVAVESRGFIFGSILAYELKCGLVLARKAGKLPHQTIREEYALEYGTAVLEIHVDGIGNGERVVVVDDLLATGGTALAAVRLVETLGGKVEGIEFLIELGFLRGREKLVGYPVNCAISY
jgi:adenine phosphoribosyltransferase